MKSTFKIMTSIYHDIKINVFSGGEINVQIPQNIYNNDTIVVMANITDAAGIMTLALIKDAISRQAPFSTTCLCLGYVPYARQDRVCNEGEALSIKVFCDMVNAMKFDGVDILDPHSDVTPALLDRCVPVGLDHVFNRLMNVTSKLKRGDLTLVAPDAGATKKVNKLADHLGGLEVIQGMKKRDLVTGKLSGFEVYGDVVGKDLLIVDDICDGGGTFLGLAAKLKAAGAKNILLYVSHGIFSKGVDVLLDGDIDFIYTTDSFNHNQRHENLQVVSWI